MVASPSPDAPETHDEKNPWGITPEKHRQILKLLRSGVSIRETARVVGVGIQTVQRRCELLHQELDEAVANELGRPSIRFRRVLGRRCAVHGPVTVWPCVACAALAARESASRN